MVPLSEQYIAETSRKYRRAVTFASAWVALAVTLALTTFGAVAFAGPKPNKILAIPADEVVIYPDGRPAPHFLLPVEDYGVVLKHGNAPGACDRLGARDIWVYKASATFIMHYDGAGPKGWLVCSAKSSNLVDWTATGAVLDLGGPGSKDERSASYGTTYFDGAKWHMFYLGTPNVSEAPNFVPSFPYNTMKAEGNSAEGPWKKQYDVVPFETRPGSYYSGSASPGAVVKVGGEYRMMFAASTSWPTVKRTLAYARTKNLNESWAVDSVPLLPPDEQIENSSIYYQYRDKTWFLFTNHVGVSPDGMEYTDAIWVYWTKDLNHWDTARKALVLDSRSAPWTPYIVGLPSVVQIGSRLALFYDGNSAQQLPAGSASHMSRDVGLAWINLPIVPVGE
jgi:hypothetical protein